MTLPVKKPFGHPVGHLLLLFSALCIFLVLTRIYLTGSMRYLWLFWNLFLAWLPLLFVMAWSRCRSIRKSTLRSTALLGSWLLFFPNAPYILTDLFHLIQYTPVPVWYDLILLLSFAWTGLLIGFVSLLQVQKFFRHKFGRAAGWAVAITALVLGSFGVYLGRYGRFNSWDIVTHPFRLSKQVLNLFLNPTDHVHSYAMIFLFSCFLVLSYTTLIALSHIGAEDHFEKPADHESTPKY